MHTFYILSVFNGLVFFCILKVIKENVLAEVLLFGLKKGELYPPEVRQFSMSMHYHSPRAYSILRNAFNHTLPHERTITLWYANSDISGEPGINQKHIDRLAQIVQKHREKTKTELLCTLIFDEMNIRNQVFWLSYNNSYEGFVTPRPDLKEEEKNKHAKQAIVFMLNGINCCLEFPISYWMIDSLNSEQRMNLVFENLKAVTSAGVKVEILTFDGYPSNLSMIERLIKTRLDVFSSNFRPIFLNPDNGEEVGIFLDPCHMEKLLRNTLANKGIIYDENGEKIEWRFIKSLYEFSKENDFNVHKLNKKHINWERNIMRVHLAVQTLSESVASAIELLMNKNHPDFVGAAATVRFLRIANKLFDVFNTKGIHNKDIFKRALHPDNKRIIFDFLNTCDQYFKALKIADKNGMLKLLVKSQNKTGFLGFIIDIDSLIRFYSKHIENGSSLLMVPTRSFQQDPLEQFFGMIRARNGFNNNPNIQHFKGAFRRLLCNLKIEAPDSGNCRIFERSLPNDYLFSNVFTVSSRRPRTTFESIKVTYEQQAERILEDIFNMERMQTNDPILDTTSTYRIAYVAKRIEDNILSLNSCDDCAKVFEENDRISNVGLQSQRLPSHSTFTVCKNVERFLAVHDIKNKAVEKYDFNVLYCLIFRSLDLDSLFPNSTFDCGSAHKYQIIKFIVGQYIATKAAYLSRQLTQDQHDTFDRHYLNKLILFQGQ